MQPNHDSWLPTGLGPAAIIGLAGLFTWCDSPGIHNSPMPPCIDLHPRPDRSACPPMPAACRRNYHSNVARAPHIVVGEGALKHLVLPHCSHLLQPYRPTAWASSRHMQTVIGREYDMCDMYRPQRLPLQSRWECVSLSISPAGGGKFLLTFGFLPSPPAPPVLRKASIRGHYTRQPIFASDGGALGLDWWKGSNRAACSGPETPVFLVLHGINGVGRGWRQGSKGCLSPCTAWNQRYIWAGWKVQRLGVGREQRALRGPILLLKH